MRAVCGRVLGGLVTTIGLDEAVTLCVVFLLTGAEGDNSTGRYNYLQVGLGCVLLPGLAV